MPKTTRLSLLLSMLLAALLSLALVACGNDDDSNGDETPSGGDPTATTEPDEGNGDETPTEASGADDEDGDDEGNGASGLDAIREAAGTVEERPISLTYEMEYPGGSASITINSDPPRHSMGVRGDLGEGESQFLTIFDGTDSFLCTQDQGMEQCLRFEGDGETPSPAQQLFLFDPDEILGQIADTEGVDVRKLDNRTIAGEDAQCFELKDDTNDQTICVGTETNIALLIEGTVDGEQMRIEATEVSLEPDESAFEPPYPVTDLGDFGGDPDDSSEE